MGSPSTGTVEDSSSALFPVGRSGTGSRGTSPVEGLRMVPNFSHDPVMASEIVALFAPVPAGVVLDATVGSGGHAEALLSAFPQLSLVGIDRDPEAVAAASSRLAAYGDRASVLRSRFGEIEAVIGVPDATRPLSGVLFDLGVSSPQLDRPDRGFSFRRSGPLDMRMDQTARRSAFDVTNALDESELAHIFALNGERWARRIARAIVTARPVQTTDQLAAVVNAAVPAAARRRGHPARRVFQAIRIEVNNELGELAAALPKVLAALAVGGRCVTLAYHSGEDRLVKAEFNAAATGSCGCPPHLPCVCGARPEHALVFRGSRKASAEETHRNPRAESARLRAVERIRAAA